MTHDSTSIFAPGTRSLATLWQRFWTRVRFEVLPSTFAIAFAMTLTLCVRGYQFGGSNHNVYLIDAMHQASGATLLANDWFTTQTLQYHAVFGILTRNLFRMGIVEPAFLVGQLVLIFLMHLAWFGIVLRLGATRMTYLLSVLIFYLMAGGVSLGVYEFLQDQAFLPSNLANVAMLWGVYFWISRKPGWSGVWLGLAGLFHLNHALVAIGLWGALNAWNMWDAFWAASASGTNPLLSDRIRAMWRSDNTRGFFVGSVMVLGIAMSNIVIGLMAVWAQTKALPLSEIIDLYVYLRHPHHYAPRTWPIALWVFFALPVPLAMWAGWRMLRRENIPFSGSARAAMYGASSEAALQYAWLEASRVIVMFSALLVTALLAAGFWFFSETLIKLSFYRFAIYIKLLSCIGAAYLIYNSGIWRRQYVRAALWVLPAALVTFGVVMLLNWQSSSSAIEWLSSFLWRHRGTAGLAIVLCTCLAIYEMIYARPWRRWRHDVLHASGIVAMAVVVYFAWGRWLGVQVLPDDEPRYLAVCEWVKRNTPTDAVFVVPPDEQSFRLHAQRAIVVNFKGVPQLNGELAQWKQRMQDVLAMPDLRPLQRRDLNQALAAIAERYEQISGTYLSQVAHQYGARYVLAARPFEGGVSARLVHAVESMGGRSYYLYDLQPG